MYFTVSIKQKSILILNIHSAYPTAQFHFICNDLQDIAQ